ncbi:MAG: hypothetical protein QOH88_2621 [Verrucomicrobiota bacterium]|jgi:hypothetical protein
MHVIPSRADGEGPPSRKETYANNAFAIHEALPSNMRSVTSVN